ncbi:MAG: hypothetical protein MIO92_08250 [Methanosarcinaceae archaeon]|nr:hypothetical protein [Methanosarcinaceae archaeon]
MGIRSPPFAFAANAHAGVFTHRLEAAHPEVGSAPQSVLEAGDELSAGMAIGVSSPGHALIPNPGAHRSAGRLSMADRRLSEKRTE